MVSALELRIKMTAQMPSIAIVMGVYNPDLTYLRSQIESIKSQTYKNWRCYISDDGSQNECLQEINKMIDERFVLYTSDKNLGTYRNYERALRLVGNEEYIFLSDQDDIWQPEKIEKFLEAFQIQLV